jgi:hypothetical protein
VLTDRCDISKLVSGRSKVVSYSTAVTCTVRATIRYTRIDRVSQRLKASIAT